MSESTAISHVPGVAITFGGRHVRQRCAWCGTVLIDEDLTRIGIIDDDGSGEFPTWSTEGLVRVTTRPGSPTLYESVDLQGENPKVPPDCCMCLPPELTLAVAEAEA